MKTIEIEKAVYEELATHVRDFNESPNDVLKRLLAQISSPRPCVSPKTSNREVSEREPSNSQSQEMLEKKEQEVPQVMDVEETETNLRALIHSTSFHELSGVERFYRVLKFLHHYSPETFEKLSAYRSGESEQVFISRNAEAVSGGLDGVQPQKIACTPFYVCSDLDNRNMRKLLGDILPGFGFFGQDVLAVLHMLPDAQSSQELAS